MNDEEGFLHAMLERPEDVALRHVYADWLEERGDPRSEMVRQQAQLQEVAQPQSAPPSPPRLPVIDAIWQGFWQNFDEGGCTFVLALLLTIPLAGIGIAIVSLFVSWLFL